MPVTFSSRPSGTIRIHRSSLLAVAIAASGLGMAVPVMAESPAAEAHQASFNVAPGALSSVLNQLARQAGITLSFDPAQVGGLQSQGVAGSYSVEQAIRQALAGTGCVVSRTESGGYSVKRGAAESSRRQLPALTISAEAVQEIALGSVEGYVAHRTASATKTDIPLMETPQSISVLTADFVDAIGSESLADALTYAPGVNTAPWGDQSHYDWLYIRGADAYSPGFYLDGLQLRNSGNWGLWKTENYGLERIELLRGPSSTLYGQGGPGGVVNLVSKRPEADGPNEIRAQLGSHNHKQLAVDVTGALDQEGQWLYRVTGLLRDAELSTADLENDRLFLAPSLTWQPNDDTRLTLLSQYMRERTGAVWHGYPTEGTLLENPNGDIPISTLLGEPDFNRYHQDQWMLGYEFEHYLTDSLRVQQNARYGTFDLDYGVIWSNGWVTQNEADPAAAENFRVVNRTPFASDEEATSVTVDTRLLAETRLGRWDHTTVLGWDYQYTRMDVLANYGGTVAPLDLYAPRYGASVELADPFINGTTRLHQSGIYLQNQAKFDDRWIVTVGGRYDQASVDNEDFNSNSRSDNSDYEFTGRAGLVYVADNGFAPYLSYSESFMPNTTINPENGQPFEPETGRQYELGARYQPLGHRARYAVAAFETVRSDYVVWEWSSGGPRQTGENTIRGIEFEAQAEPVDNLNLHASYSWIPKADVTESANAAQVGKQDLAVSEHQVSVWSDYRLGNGLKLGLGVRYTGSNDGTKEEAPKPLPSSTLVDALVSYELPDWLFSLNVRNLTDRETLPACGSDECYYGERRKVLANVSYRW